MTSASRRADALASTRRTSAARAITPPSPSLSARRTNTTYLTDTMSVTDQKISEITPYTSAAVGAHRAVVDGEHGLHRVQRAGADVAVHHPERAEHQRRAPHLRGASTLGGALRI